MGESQELKELDIVTKATSRTLMDLTPEQVVEQLFQSEDAYVRLVLEVATKTFEKRLRDRITVKKPIVSETEVNGVFLNLSAIYEFNKQLLDELTALKYEGQIIAKLAGRIKQFVPFFKVYSIYLRGHEGAMKLYNKLLKNSKFVKFVKFNELSSGIPLSTLLKIPCVRIPQYVIYLEVLAGKISDEKVRADIHSIASQLQEVTCSISESLRDVSAREAVIEIQKHVFADNIDIVEPSRYLIKRGTVRRVLPKNNYFPITRTLKVELILFNDIILWGVVGKQVERVMRLENIEVVSVDAFTGVENAFGIRETRGKVLFVGKSSIEKAEWLDEIQGAIDAWKVIASTQAPVDPNDFEKMIMKKKKKEDLTDAGKRLEQFKSKPASLETGDAFGSFLISADSQYAPEAFKSGFGSGVHYSGYGEPSSEYDGYAHGMGYHESGPPPVPPSPLGHPGISMTPPLVPPSPIAPSSIPETGTYSFDPYSAGYSSDPRYAHPGLGYYSHPGYGAVAPTMEDYASQEAADYHQAHRDSADSESETFVEAYTDPKEAAAAGNGRVTAFMDPATGAVYYIPDKSGMGTSEPAREEPLRPTHYTASPGTSFPFAHSHYSSSEYSQAAYPSPGVPPPVPPSPTPFRSAPPPVPASPVVGRPKPQDAAASELARLREARKQLESKADSGLFFIVPYLNFLVYDEFSDPVAAGLTIPVPKSPRRGPVPTKAEMSAQVQASLSRFRAKPPGEIEPTRAD